MESLYTTYRPQTFADVAGQRPVVGALERAVLNKAVGHAYLFCGPRGTGKTTMARILAKALLCEAGPGVLPDGTCEQCKAVALGVHPDVLEIDAASRTSVNDIREEIISKVDFAPVLGHYKVYVIDEVHMLSVAAFNALLKTLEEPPSHVVFILCTTDPQKVPATILSRVQRFNFLPLTDEDIRSRLAYICEQEGYEAEPEALELIVSHAHGGMRDAISTLEQLAIFGEGAVSASLAHDLLGATDEATLKACMEALAAYDGAALFKLVAQVVGKGQDLRQFAGEVLRRARDLYVVFCAGVIPELLGANQVEATELVRESKLFGSAERISRVLTGLDDLGWKLRDASNARLELEVALTKLVRPESDLTLEALAERVARLEARQGGEALYRRAEFECEPGGEPESELGGKPAPGEQKKVAPPALAAKPVLPADRESRSGAAGPVGSAAPLPHQTKAAAGASSAATPNAAPPVFVHGEQPQNNQNNQNKLPQSDQAQNSSNPKASPALLWERVVASLPPVRAALLAGSQVANDDGAKLVVAVDDSPLTQGMLNRADVIDEIERALKPVFGTRRFVPRYTTAPSHATPSDPGLSGARSAVGANAGGAAESAPASSSQVWSQRPPLGPRAQSPSSRPPWDEAAPVPDSQRVQPASPAPQQPPASQRAAFLQQSAPARAPRQPLPPPQPPAPQQSVTPHPPASPAPQDQKAPGVVAPPQFFDALDRLASAFGDIQVLSVDVSHAHPS